MNNALIKEKFRIQEIIEYYYHEDNYYFSPQKCLKI